MILQSHLRELLMYLPKRRLLKIAALIEFPNPLFRKVDSDVKSPPAFKYPGRVSITDPEHP